MSEKFFFVGREIVCVRRVRVLSMFSLSNVLSISFLVCSIRDVREVQSYILVSLLWAPPAIF
jgi:hypothetical protein